MNKLFQISSEDLIISIQDLIKIIIRQFIKSGAFRYDESADIQQQVNEELLYRLTRIQNQYKGKASPKTYMAAVIRNICHDIRRKRSNAPSLISFFDEMSPSDSFSIIDSMVIKEESRKLHGVIELYFKQKGKLMACLKLKYNVPLEYGDLLKVDGKITRDDFQWFLMSIYPFDTCTDVAKYAALTALLNKYGRKQIEPDSLRKWAQLKIKEIIGIMNQGSVSSAYTEEVLQILFEFSYVNMFNKLNMSVKEII